MTNEVKKVFIEDPAKLPGTLKRLGGSQSDDWNNIVAEQAYRSTRPLADENASDRHHTAIAQAMIGINPQDELEGMIGAQLIACHNAAMEGYRRAMISDQSLEGYREFLNQANKASRTYATLLEALNRHRGKGQQKMTVEHVHVHSGGQAIVGNVGQGGGVPPKPEDQPHARQITHAPLAAVPSTYPAREPVLITGNAERSMSNARRKVTGRTKGK